MEIDKNDREEYWEQSKEDILKTIKLIKEIDEKPQVDDEDINYLFGVVTKKTDVNVLFLQFMEAMLQWCIVLKLYENREDYELCSDVLEMIHTIKKHYILFIDSYYGVKDDDWFEETYELINKTIKQNKAYKEITKKLNEL